MGRKLIDVSINIDVLFENEYFRNKLKEFLQEEKAYKTKEEDLSGKWYKLEDVIKMTGLSRSSIYFRMRDNEFPQPIKIGKRAIRWTHNDIIKWINGRIDTNNMIN